MIVKIDVLSEIKEFDLIVTTDRKVISKKTEIKGSGKIHKKIEGVRLVFNLSGFDNLEDLDVLKWLWKLTINDSKILMWGIWYNVYFNGKKMSFTQELPEYGNLKNISLETIEYI